MTAKKTVPKDKTVSTETMNAVIVVPGEVAKANTDKFFDGLHFKRLNDISTSTVLECVGIFVDTQNTRIAMDETFTREGLIEAKLSTIKTLAEQNGIEGSLNEKIEALIGTPKTKGMDREHKIMRERIELVVEKNPDLKEFILNAYPNIGELIPSFLPKTQ